ncbi:Gamma-curcumene synthase [Handroanthus impetiginosus]|uniref:Gamma-curcumene synthase n=1 Tax=Handroanthus impetiginosus TaxID=429701 RepID=A0A2G9G4P5_9LAMI|nr:Gamma-curcumene synthase [Handroanthus impetiginosus]
MNKDKKLKETLIGDIEGLLSLYEAAHIRMHGEDILEEAVAFTTHHLTRVLPQLESPIKDKVKRALEHPIHKAVLIIEARLYISIYEKEKSRDEVLLKMAKLNFNYLQNLYTRMSSPNSPVRIAISKSIQLVAVADDTYDNYATLEEAQLFSEVLERWNVDEIELLPDCMKTVYQFIMSIFEEYERDATKQEKSFAIPYFKESLRPNYVPSPIYSIIFMYVKQLAWAYIKELKWIAKQELPSFEEYYANSLITSTAYVIFIALVPGMKSVTKETIDWLLSEPKIVITTNKMSRYYDDLGSYELIGQDLNLKLKNTVRVSVLSEDVDHVIKACRIRESVGGTMLTAVDCYMKDLGVSKQEAFSKIVELIEEGWKILNTEWITNTYSIPEDMLVQLLNYVRVAAVAYNNGEDGYSNPRVLGPYIHALFVEPIFV